MNKEIRQQFPMTEELVYLETGGIGTMPLAAIEAAHAFLEARKRSPDTEHLWLATTDAVRGMIAELIGAKPNEIAITTSTTEGMNIIANALDWKEGDNIVIDDLDYPSNRLIWRDCQERKGIEIRIVKSEAGSVPLERFEEAVDDRTRLISFALVSHKNGYLHDAKALGRLADSHGAYVLTDAVQAVGSIPVDVKEMGIDFLACSCYKWLLGPLGLGFLYVNEELLDKVHPITAGWMQIEEYVTDAAGFVEIDQCRLFDSARKFERGTIHWQGIYELKASLEFMQTVGWDKVYDQVLKLSLMTQERLAKLGLQLFTPRGNRSGLATAFIQGGVGKKIGNALEEKKIIIKSRPGYIRVDPHFYNTEEEIDIFIEELKKLLVQFGVM
jgi:cysteine desulfurase/selenocysteine lyase